MSRPLSDAHAAIVTAAQRDAEVLAWWLDACRDYRDSDREAALACHRELTKLGIVLPSCWCGCDEPAIAWESDGGEVAAEGCTDYACDDDGQPVCECDSRVEDHGQWTGGGMHGCGTGRVSDLRVSAEVQQ